MTDQLEHGGSLSTEKVTYRGYAKYNEKGEVEEVNAKAESANQASWKKMEEKKDAAGNLVYTQFNQNEFVRYSVKSEEGFSLLVPDPTQRLYIIQSGLNYIQNAKSNGIMVEVEEDKITPTHNDETIDLRAAINEPPSKRSLTDEEKLLRTIAGMGLSPEQVTALFAQVSATLKPAAELEAGVEESVEA